MIYNIVRALRTVLRRWPMQLLGLLLLCLSLAVVAYTYQSSERVVRQYATETAKTHADLVTQFRNFYTLELAPLAQKSGMALTHDYKNQPHALPLPATLTIELGHYLSRVDGGTQVSLYSDQPFPWREKERVLDDFQREALAHLKLHPDQPYVREQWRDGERVLRYAQADRMLQRCVQCHNSYPGSPRTDWKVGDVRGALEVVLPVSHWQLASTQVLNRTFVVLLLVCSCGLALIWFFVRRMRLALATADRLSHEREQAMHDLRLSESKLVSIFQSVPDGIVVANQEGRIVQCNPAVSDIFGYPAKALRGRNVSLLMDAAVSQEHASFMQRYLTSGDKRLIDQPRLLQGRRADGSLLPLRLTLRETCIDNERIFIALIQDYTSVQKTQDLLIEARDKAEQVNRLRGEFLANMSHEIRTPMNGIVGMTELALNSQDDAERRQYLDLARESSHHLLHIINEILDFSKIEAGALELELLPVDPAQLIRHSAHALEPLAHGKGLRYEIALDAALPSACLLDSVRVRQVLTNLIGNAIKFTREGSVTVQAQLLPGTASSATPADSADGATTATAAPETPEAPETPNGLLRIVVSDTGIGFDPARAEALFSPFTQADGSVTRSFGGTGLGLAITRSLLQLMNGTVTAHSRPGQGSQFVVDIPLLPVRQPHSPVAPEPEHPAQPGAGRALRVLLVEDHPVNQLLAQKLLDAMGHSHLTAGNGQEALDCLQQDSRFDVVLMDVMMPMVDGLTALQLWREREAGTAQHLPVIMVTAHAMTGDRERFMQAGADGYVSKPLMPDTLRQEIERVLAAQS